MNVSPPFVSDQRVQHLRFGAGTVVLDRGMTAIVRFDHGLEECEREALALLRSAEEKLATGAWDAPLAVVTKAQAAAIVSVNDAWGVFSRSRIALLPHQLWVCRRVLSTWPARWLVADDVGLGKTIEAGLILWPLLSKGVVRRLLILCPASLVEQWQYRLRTMFDIRVARYASEADTDRGDFWGTHSHVVASLETLRADHGGRHRRLLEAPSWDLLIIDEAHHVNADEEAGPTLGYKLAQRLADDKKVVSMVFFTGTPHRGKNYGFLALLQLLRPDVFDPRKPLSGQLHSLRDVVIRNNKQCVTDLQGNRLFQAPQVTSETYVYSPQEARFYEMLTEFILSGKAYASTLGASDGRIVMLVLISMQKLASSSVAAIRRALRRRLARLVEERTLAANSCSDAGQRGTQLGADYTRMFEAGQDDELSKVEEELAAVAIGARLMEDEEPRLQELLDVADGIRAETKIGKILALLDSAFQDRAVLFFTEYKATQSLLMSELVRRFGDGCVGFINGDARADEVLGLDGQPRTLHQTREDAADQFNGGRIRFLVSTEAGGEGIDLQEQCYTLVHVDLPWNPMRLHQRVGRLNRYGQRQRVDVVTLRNPDTVESRIWDRLNEKIASISLAFGHLMDEPEDLLQLVLGMTSPSLFRDLFAGAAAVPSESLGTWFNHRAATFGGRDVVATVKEMIGNCARFDFNTVGADVPNVDLPDLRPFLEGMLTLNRRRARRSADGSLGFKTPEPWLEEVGVRTAYEGLIFDRAARGKDALQKIVGIGHKALDQAVSQAIQDSACVAAVSHIALPMPIVVLRVVDRVTSGSAIARSAVIGLEQSGDGNRWLLLRDWQLILRLNELLGPGGALRRTAIVPEDLPSVAAHIAGARIAATAELSSLDLGLRVPALDLVAVLWPGAEGGQFAAAEGENIANDEQSEW